MRDGEGIDDLTIANNLTKLCGVRNDSLIIVRFACLLNDFLQRNGGTRGTNMAGRQQAPPAHH